jgi:hypothetical protein
MSLIDRDKVPARGALRSWTSDGWLEANPHDQLFSTVSMNAIQFWDGFNWKWVSPEIKAEHYRKIFQE